jgi:hypothetical protein
MFRPTDEQSDVRWRPVKNAAGEDVPAFAVVVITGKDADTQTTIIDKPTADSTDQRLLMVNGPGVIPAGGFGSATRDYPILALVSAGAAVSAELGTAAGSWTLTAGKSGFMAVTTESGGSAVVVGGGGGTAAGVEFVRITSWFCKDHAGATGCDGSPSPRCYYPGRIQKWDCASGYTNDPDKEPVWVDLTFSAQAPIQPITTGAPATTVVVDGNTIVMAKSLGKRYAPDNGGTTPPHPNNGEDRPVYGSDAYSGVIIVTCGPPIGGIMAGEGG